MFAVLQWNIGSGDSDSNGTRRVANPLLRRASYAGEKKNDCYDLDTR